MLNFTRWIESTTYVAYTGIVLNPEDRQRLIELTSHLIPEGWDVKADHMTINLKEADKGPALDYLNKEVRLTANAFAHNDKVMAVAVNTEIPIVNEIKHITIAVSPTGKSSDSNNLTEWKPIPAIHLTGVVKEVQGMSEKKIKPPIKPNPPAPNDPTEFVKALSGKPPGVIKLALKGKFPHLQDGEIDLIIQRSLTTNADDKQ